MLSGYWLLADLDGTLISTPHKANGSYLPITRSPCYDSVRRWLLHGGSICIVTTADERVIDQVYRPLRPLLPSTSHSTKAQGDAGRSATPARTIMESAAGSVYASQCNSLSTAGLHSATRSHSPSCPPGELLLSLYSGAVLYRCSFDGVELVAQYVRRTHCATKESADRMTRMGLAEQRYRTYHVTRVYPGTSTIDGMNTKNNHDKNIKDNTITAVRSNSPSEKSDAGAEERPAASSPRLVMDSATVMEPRIGVTGTCLSDASHARLMEIIARAYDQLIDHVLHGDQAALHGLQKLSHRYKKMWIALLTLLEAVYRCHAHPSRAHTRTDGGYMHAGAIGTDNNESTPTAHTVHTRTRVEERTELREARSRNYSNTKGGAMPIRTHAPAALSATTHASAKEALQQWVQYCRDESADVVAWKVRYVRSRRGLLPALGVVRTERVVGMHTAAEMTCNNSDRTINDSNRKSCSRNHDCGSHSGQHNTSDVGSAPNYNGHALGDAVSLSPARTPPPSSTASRDYIVQLLTEGVMDGTESPPSCMTAAAQAFVDQMEVLMGGLPQRPAPMQSAQKGELVDARGEKGAGGQRASEAADVSAQPSNDFNSASPTSSAAPSISQAYHVPRGETNTESQDSIAQIIVLGVPMTLYARYFAPSQSDFARAGAQAMPQPNSIVFSKLGINKSTVLRYLLGKDWVMPNDGAAPPAAVPGDYLGCVRSTHCIALGDNPHTTDYELTVFPDVTFVSVERDEQRHARHHRIQALRDTLAQGGGSVMSRQASHVREEEGTDTTRARLHKAENVTTSTATTHSQPCSLTSAESGTAVLPVRALNASLIESELTPRLRHSGPLMDDRMLNHLLYVGGEECGTAYFLNAWMDYLKVPRTMSRHVRDDHGSCAPRCASAWSGAALGDDGCESHVHVTRFRAALPLAQRAARSKVEHSISAKL